MMKKLKDKPESSISLPALCQLYLVMSPFYNLKTLSNLPQTTPSSPTNLLPFIRLQSRWFQPLTPNPNLRQPVNGKFTPLYINYISIIISNYINKIFFFIIPFLFEKFRVIFYVGIVYFNHVIPCGKVLSCSKANIMIQLMTAAII